MKTLALTTAATTAILGCAAVASADANFYLYGQVDLTPATSGADAIGNNPIAVAWDGANAYVAGFNASGSDADTGIVRITDVLGTASFSSRFGTRTTPNNRGYSGLDITTGGASLGAVYDDGTTTNSLAVYNPDGSQRWATNLGGRPPAGPAFDPTTSRVSALYFGTNIIRNYNATDGSATGNADTGFGALGGTAYRDFVYASDGDVFARNENDVYYANRVNFNTYDGQAEIVDLADSTALGANIAYVESAGVAIYNDRASGLGGQAFADVVAGVMSNGTAETLNFLSIDGGSTVAFADGNALYDFSYDAASDTLAITDFANRQLYVFGTSAVAIPEPTSLALMGGLAGLTLLRRRRNG